MWLGQHYEEMGELNQALEVSKAGLKLRPDNLDYKYLIGSLLFRTERAEEALLAREPGGALVAAATDTTAADPAVPIDAEALFTTYLCNTCHSFDGTAGAGPSLQGLASRQTREQVVQSLREPDAVIVEGYAPGAMGATINAMGFANITDAEFEALVDYLMEQN